MPPHDQAEALLNKLLAALDQADPVRAAERVWPLLGARPAGQVVDQAGLARLLANERHRGLLAPLARELRGWDRREGAARAELLVTPRHDETAHAWLVTLACTADGRWWVSGLQREGFEG